MPLLMRYKPVGLTAAQYDEVDAKFQASEHWPPDGLLLHVCFGKDDALMVSEVWESQEHADAHLPHLRPVLDAAGITMNDTDVEVLDVHKLEVLAPAAV